MRTPCLIYHSPHLQRLFLVLIVSITYANLSFGQELQDGQKRWSADSKLSLDDFKIKISDNTNEIAFSQFMFSHAIGGFDFMKKNLNQKVDNIFLGNASYMDTTKIENIAKQLEFQQMQFDLSEIQARHFRKRILKDKSKLAKGFDIVNSINNDIMEELTKMRMDLMRETDGGRDIEKVMEWKERIAAQLSELNDFRFENKEKIRLIE